MGNVLALAAAPTFAIMALLTALGGGDEMYMMCAAAHASPLNGMVPMYLAMTAFHSTPWLRLMANWRAAAGCRRTEVS
jgi:hypothetical protein